MFKVNETLYINPEHVTSIAWSQRDGVSARLSNNAIVFMNAYNTAEPKHGPSLDLIENPAERAIEEKKRKIEQDKYEKKCLEQLIRCQNDITEAIVEMRFSK